MNPWASEEAWQSQLVAGRPFLDVRAPVEFAQGALPGAVNIPLLNNDERHLVGLTYKERGPEAALALGHQLVGGPIKEERLQKWRSLLQASPGLILYCFRGGQRSAITQKWLQEAGAEVQRIEGGYKRVREFFIETLDQWPSRLKLMSLSGHTGSGKTRVLRQMRGAPAPFRIIDLEGLARHRGSAFGGELEPQPSQAQFENEIAVEFLRAAQFPEHPVWLEDEGRMIGQVTLPNSLFGPLRECPLVVIEESRQSRAEMILEEYVIEAYRSRMIRNPETAWHDLSRDLSEPIRRITPKLGGANAQTAFQLLNEALTHSEKKGEWDIHLKWILFLLEHYYDAYYEKHLERQSPRIIFRGPREEIKGTWFPLQKL